MSDLESLVDGFDSKAGLRLAVMPARLKVTDCTAEAGAYVTLALIDWIFEPAG